MPGLGVAAAVAGGQSAQRRGHGPESLTRASFRKSHHFLGEGDVPPGHAPPRDRTPTPDRNSPRGPVFPRPDLNTEDEDGGEGHVPPHPLAGDDMVPPDAAAPQKPKDDDGCCCVVS